MKIEHMRLSELKTWPRNPKAHDASGLSKSMDRFGFVAPLIIDEGSGRLVAGHGRLDSLLARKAAGLPPPEHVRAEAGDWRVPVVRGVKFKDEMEAEGYLVADNRLTSKGGWDTKALAAILSDLSKEERTLDGSGYSFADVKTILREINEAPPVGRTPADLLPGYQAAEVKQVVLYFDGADYDDFSKRFAAAQERLGAENPSATLLKLIERHEAARGDSAEG